MFVCQNDLACWKRGDDIHSELSYYLFIFHTSEKKDQIFINFSSSFYSFLRTAAFIHTYTIYDLHNSAIINLHVLADSTSSTHQLEESILGSSISLHDSVEADNILTISGAHTTGSTTAASSGMCNSSYAEAKAVSVKAIAEVSKIINCVSKFMLQLTIVISD